jgi:hypothetical protein
MNEVLEELNRILDNAEDIGRQIYQVSDNIYSIEDGRIKKTQLRNLVELTYPISSRLRELININSDYRNIADTFIDENGIDYEVILFDEINAILESIERKYTTIVENIDRKITEIESIGNARTIPEDEQELTRFNEEIINQSTCSICLVKVVNTKIDCGHLFCVTCVINLTECPLCRKPIESISKIFLKKYLKYKNKYMLLKEKRTNLHNKI